MGFLDLFRRKPETETRSSGTGFTAQLIGARRAYIAGVSGIGELTATVQSCVSLWENGLSLAHVTGTDLLTRHTMAVAARSLALRGEAVFLMDNGLVPAVDWELSRGTAGPALIVYRCPRQAGTRRQPPWPAKCCISALPPIRQRRGTGRLPCAGPV